MARPTDCTPEVTAKVAQAIRAGNFFDPACRYAGIDPATGYRWKQRAQEALALSQETGRPVPKSEQPFCEFRKAVEDADASAEVELVAILMNRAKGGDTRAADILLKKRFRQNWQDSQLVENRSLDERDPEEKEIRAKLAAMPADDLLAIVKEGDAA